MSRPLKQIKQKKTMSEPLACRRSSRLQNKLVSKVESAMASWRQELRQRLKDHKLISVQDFERWVLGTSDKHHQLLAAFDDEDRILEIMAERWDKRGEHYEVRWSDSYMHQRHLDLYKHNNYQPLKVEICHSSPPAFPWDPHMLRIKWETSIEP